jgi:hypothetical protein
VNSPPFTADTNELLAAGPKTTAGPCGAFESRTGTPAGWAFGHLDAGAVLVLAVAGLPPAGECRRVSNCATSYSFRYVRISSSDSSSEGQGTGDVEPLREWRVTDGPPARLEGHAVISRTDEDVKSRPPPHSTAALRRNCRLPVGAVHMPEPETTSRCPGKRFADERPSPVDVTPNPRCTGAGHDREEGRAP